MQYPYLICLLSLLLSCGDSLVETEAAGEVFADPYAIASNDGDVLNAVVEIPAGTNQKIEYHKESGYQSDTLDGGVDRVIEFLPYPGNYGFVPSTLMDEARGGDGDALDILIIGESQPTGTVQGVKPIGALLLRDRGEIDTKIIAIPADERLRTIDVDNFLDFALANDAAKRIIELWFLNYKGPNTTQLIRWEDEAYAWREVEKWKINAKTGG